MARLGWAASLIAPGVAPTTVQRLWSMAFGVVRCPRSAIFAAAMVGLDRPRLEARERVQSAPFSQEGTGSSDDESELGPPTGLPSRPPVRTEHKLRDLRLRVLGFESRRPKRTTPVFELSPVR